MSGVSYLELLKLVAPETILVLTVIVLLAADFLALRDLELRLRLLVSAMIAGTGFVGFCPMCAIVGRRYIGTDK